MELAGGLIILAIIVAIITWVILSLDKAWNRKLDQIRNNKIRAQEKQNPPKTEKLSELYGQKKKPCDDDNV